MKNTLICLVLLASYVAASTMDYRRQTEPVVKESLTTEGVTDHLPDAGKMVLDREAVEELVRYAVLVEGLDWDETQVELMASIAWRESRFDPRAQNPESSAYGLFQLIDQTWEGTRIAKTDDPLLQTIAAVRYVKARYGSPSEAYLLHLSRGWY